MAEHMSGEEQGNAGQLAATVADVWRRRRWLAVDCMMVPLAATLAVAAFLPNLYRSSALVEVQHENGAPVDAAAATAQLQRLNEENLSRSHLEATIDRFELYPQIRRKASMEAAVDQMRHDVLIEMKDANASTVAFTVGYRGSNPTRVAEVANALASFYVERSQEQAAQQAKGAIAGIQSQVDTTKARLDAQEKAADEFISSHLQELPDQVRVNLSALDRLNLQLQSLNHSGRSRSISRTSSGETIVSAGTPQADAQDTELLRLNQELSELRGRVTDEYPDVVHLKAQIASLSAARRRQAAANYARPAAPAAAPTAALTASAGDENDEPRYEGRSSAEQRARLRQQIAAVEAKVYSAPRREQELQSLLAPLSATRQQYATLLERLDTARSTESIERQRALIPFRVLDSAVAARVPAGPNRMKIAGVGIVLSLIFALLCVFLAEKMDTSFHSLDELRRFTRVPVLASVPNIVAPQDTLRIRRRARWAAALVAVAAGMSVAASYALVHDNEPLVWMLARGHA